MAETSQTGAPFVVPPPIAAGNFVSFEREGAPMPVYQPFMFEAAPARSSPALWIVLGLGLLLLAGGIIFHAASPREAAAQPKPLNVQEMTARQLAEDAGPTAATELARRMGAADSAARADALDAVQTYSTPRLTQNMAMAMALEVQKRQAQVMADVERRVRMAEEGGDPGPMPRR